MASNPTDVVPIGGQVGPYRVESVLGQGGMGCVYKAVDAGGRAVALKLVKPDLAHDDTFRRRFAREARVAQSVLHPNVVPVLGTGQHDGIPYMAQRFVDAGSLAERLDRENELAVADVAHICVEVASGLDGLHAGGLIHRDVKPANILIDTTGNVYITDFGLAKDTAGTILTKAGQALGSMDYMAPEQVRGEAVTQVADVYALACTAWECLVGRAPFSDRMGMRVLWAHLQDTPEDPCALRPDVPRGMGDAILRALDKDPAARPQSAGEFARVISATAGV